MENYVITRLDYNFSDEKVEISIFSYSLGSFLIPLA